MKERIIQPKKITADSFSIPSLKQPIRGFGSQPSSASSSAVPDNSLVHDISRIPLRRPQTKLTINQPGDMYEQQADAVAHEVVGRLGQLENHASIQRQQIPGEYNPESRGGQELLAHELTHVVQQSGGAVQRTHAENKSEDLLSQKSVQRKITTQSLTSFPVQRLLYKTDNTNVDIDTLSFARVLDYLKRPDPDLDPGGVIFEPSDKARLSAKADELYVSEFDKLHTFLGEEPVNNEKTKRNLPTTLDLPKLLTDMQTRYAKGDLPGFREWLAGTNVNLRAENVLDKINELRSAKDIVGAVNVDETAIVGTSQTADLTHADSQTEVKTIRKPIQGYQDFTGQVTAALGKFANVDPADGKTYNAAIYASIDENLIAGKTTTKKGTVSNTRIDATTLDKVTTLTRESDGEILREMTDNQLDKLLHNLNTQSWAGADRTHNIDIFLENGTPQHLIRNLATNQWARA
ncbi:MAG: DUF4157 domain-containing protein [Nostoc sp. ChiSLP02]|nr:DUF4157 domain-containing protein [Nostoc sp. DedSLP05]MDZ8102030.1 DUF4157 domain-containing protein [Nostoc sp. DedSLP01]MDZ8188767.1 DUF4157 domain-containing protein [Nostoc sp. ChiSLP02]